MLDYGFVGDVDNVNADLIQNHNGKIALVFAPITHDQRGNLLNTNADNIARKRPGYGWTL